MTLSTCPRGAAKQWLTRGNVVDRVGQGACPLILSIGPDPCYSSCMSETLTERDWRAVARASAHVRPADELRAAQRFQNGVTEEDVARLLLHLERGVRLYRNRLGRWLAPTGSPLGRYVSTSVLEAIRTGLVRHYRDREGDHLIPAKVHVAGPDGQSVCHFVGEDLGPTRARLVTVSDLAIADCLDCTQRAV